jgi:thioesterase domain-containing protein
MSTPIRLFAVAGVLVAAGAAYAQFPIMDAVADKLIQKYQTSTCEQLWQEKEQRQSKPMSGEEQRAMEMLRSDPQMQAAFFGKVSTPIVTKMFQCGMIP